jgi:signal transduction histidine kinase
VTNAVERQASTVSVTVQLGDDVLAVMVSDNGLSDGVARRDDGLSRIADRVGALNGTLEWGKDSNQGTTVRASIPVRRGRGGSKDHLCR